MRELIKDVHSISLLVRSSVAGLKFGVTLRDNPSGIPGYSLASLCTIPTAGVWTLITLPNLPIWTSSGIFSMGPGIGGYSLSICLAAGSTYTVPANNAWQSGNFLGAVGQSNFANNLVNSTFDIAFVQHEPSPICTQLLDKPFSQNLDECQRYYSKSYDYGVVPGTADFNGSIGGFLGLNVNGCIGTAVFPRKMAKGPAVICYNPNVANTQGMYNSTSGAQAGGAAAWIGERGFSQVAATSQYVVGNNYVCHYTADTGM